MTQPLVTVLPRGISSGLVTHRANFGKVRPVPRAKHKLIRSDGGRISVSRVGVHVLTHNYTNIGRYTYEKTRTRAI